MEQLSRGSINGGGARVGLAATVLRIQTHRNRQFCANATILVRDGGQYCFEASLCSGRLWKQNMDLGTNLLSPGTTTRNRTMSRSTITVKRCSNPIESAFMTRSNKNYHFQCVRINDAFNLRLFIYIIYLIVSHPCNDIENVLFLIYILIKSWIHLDLSGIYSLQIGKNQKSISLIRRE